MTDKPNKLFHVLVVVGASLTGGACGGQTSALPVDQDAARDAANDAKDAAADRYVGIAPPPCNSGPGGRLCDAGADVYGQISPFDAGADSYAQITPNLDSGHDAYIPIVPPPLDAGEDVYVGIAPAIDASYPPIG